MQFGYCWVAKKNMSCPCRTHCHGSHVGEFGIYDPLAEPVEEHGPVPSKDDEFQIYHVVPCLIQRPGLAKAVSFLPPVFAEDPGSLRMMSDDTNAKKNKV